MPAKPVPRTQASSGDEEFFQETLNLAEALVGHDSGIPDELEDELYGQNPKNDPEVQYQRGQEVATVVVMPGWAYIVESLHKMVQEYKSAHERAINDEDILRTHREAKISESIVNRILNNVDMAAKTPHPDELPE